jgi:hypothetical protein
MTRPPRTHHWWPLLLSFVEAAEYSGIDDQRLRRMAAKGEIDVMSVSDNGGKKKIPRIALDRLITTKPTTEKHPQEATP